MDNQGYNHPFSHATQTIIVDNSIPIPPNFTVSQTSTTIFVNSWSSWDQGSNAYTFEDPTSGINGIKNYKVFLKDLNNNIISSKSFAFDEAYYWTFTGLTSNNTYKAGVTATDLANNSNTTEVNVTTAPAPPVISPAAQSFCNISLSWDAVAGASSYNIYNGTTHALITNTASTTYTVTDLSAGSTYKFYAKAKNASNQSSDQSNILQVATQTVPTPSISGSSPVCSSGTSFSVNNKPDECTLA